MTSVQGRSNHCDAVVFLNFGWRGMTVRAVFVAGIWLLLGAILSVLLVRDVMRAGIAVMGNPAVGLWSVSLAAFGIACIALSYGIFARRVFAKPLGVTLALLLGVLLVMHVALNTYMFWRAGLAISLVACGAGLVGIWFCWLTAAVARFNGEAHGRSCH